MATLSICYRCGSCGRLDRFTVRGWSASDKYFLCAKCVEDLERAKFKILKAG